MKSIRVKVTNPDLPEEFRISYARCMMPGLTPKQTCLALNKLALRCGVNATYELATEADYQAYRASLQALVAGE